MSQCRLNTPIGKLGLSTNTDGLLAIQWPDQLDPVPGDDDNSTAAEDILELACSQLSAYFAGDCHRFSVPLAPQGTRFQHQVWSALRAIPYGHTASYGEIAAALGNPNASRAVGAAAGKNPIPIIVPCHRMLGRNGSLTGFAGGLAVKRRLLQLEGLTL